MGYNISDVSGNSTGGVDVWEFTLDLTQPGVSSVSGDFDVVDIVGGGNQGEATDGYAFSALSTTAFGTLTSNATDGTFTFDVDRSAAMQSGSDQVVSFTVTGTSGSDSDQDTVNINILICVAQGTRIDTPRGAVPVESLSPGDRVRTADGAPRTVRWLGSRRVTRRELLADPALRPVRISAGALGEGARTGTLSSRPSTAC